MNVWHVARTSRSRSSKRFTRFAILACAFALASSVLATPRAPQPKTAVLTRSSAGRQVVLLALDGVRYQDVFEGVDAEMARERGVPADRVVSAEKLMPELHALIEHHGAALGAPGRGAAVSASGPDFVSLPGYSEMLTGSRDSGCADNQCRGTRATSLADDLAEASPAARVAVISSWPDIERVAARSPRVSVSTGRHAGRTRRDFLATPRAKAALERAEGERPWPGHDDYRRDRFTADLALAYLEEAQPDFLFVSLGEADEFGHQGNYAGYLEAVQHADQRIGELWRVLEQSAARGVETTLIVTADHGRARGFRDHGRVHPESARVWLVAAGSSVGARGLISAPEPRALADIAPTLRERFGLPAVTSSSAGKPLRELLWAATP